MLKIVLVDDDETHRSLMEKVLRLEGYDVFVAAGGAQALQLVRAKKPDLLVSDVLMPQMSGTELTRLVRQEAGLQDTYIMLVTGESAQEVKLDALRAGADDYIHKPIRRDEFLARVEIALKVRHLQDEARKLGEKAAKYEKTATAAGAAYETILKELETIAGLLKAKDEFGAFAAVYHLRDKVRAAKEGAGPAAPEKSLGDMLGLT